MKKTLLLLALALLSINTFGQMVLEYDVRTANTQIKLPLGGTVNVTINWGDGSAIETVSSPDVKVHVYTNAGTKTVTITGTLTQFGNFFVSHGPSLIKVLSWEGLGLISLQHAFSGATALTSVPSNLPTSVTDLTGAFYNTTSFNHPIGTWNTSNVSDMSYMVYGATSFNQPIGTWNTSNVLFMRQMFRDATSFNQPIGNWNTQNVIDMSSMFSSATSFNQPIGTWNTAKVTFLGSMFYGATDFNQPISSWNTANVSDMSYMFANATSFNQPLGSWDITKVSKMGSMFSGNTLCTSNYDNLLNGWAVQPVQTGVVFDGANYIKYSTAAASARATLISKGWIISDGGLGISGNCKVTELEDQPIDAPAEVYPNPAATEVYSTGFAQLYDVTGKLVAEGQGKIDVFSLPRGMYILKSENKTTKIVLR